MNLRTLGGSASLFLLLTLSALVQAEQAPQGLPAEVITVQPRELIKPLNVIGNLLANERVTIRPELAGRIAQIHFDDGDQVQQGDKLFSLDNTTYLAALNQVSSGRDLSQLEYDQAEQLLQRKHGSRLERDRALAQLQIDQAKVKLAQTQLDKMTLFAPFTGTLGFRQVSPGDYVNAGQDLVELVDYSRLKVEFQVAEKYLNQLKIGQQVNIQVDAFPKQTFSGSIYAIAPWLDQRGRSIQIRARIDNPQRLLRPGLFARIEIVLSRNDQALMVPEAAIIPKGDGFYVYRVVDDKVEQVAVVIGQRQQGWIELTEGIAAGDIIITAGQIKLRPGMPVTAIAVDGAQP